MRAPADRFTPPLGQTLGVTDAPDPTTTPATTGATTRTRRLAPRHLAWFALATIAIVCIVIAARLGTSDTAQLDGGRIQRLIPSPGAKILQQDEIGIDMAPGYEASLMLNGIPLPIDQTNIVPPINQVTFKPGPGKVYERLPAGQNCILATYWQSQYGPSVSSTRTWCFTVV